MARVPSAGTHQSHPRDRSARTVDARGGPGGYHPFTGDSRVDRRVNAAVGASTGQQQARPAKGVEIEREQGVPRDEGLVLSREDEQRRLPHHASRVVRAPCWRAARLQLDPLARRLTALAAPVAAAHAAGRPVALGGAQHPGVAQHPLCGEPAVHQQSAPARH